MTHDGGVESGAELLRRGLASVAATPVAPSPVASSGPDAATLIPSATERVPDARALAVVDRLFAAVGLAQQRDVPVAAVLFGARLRMCDGHTIEIGTGESLVVGRASGDGHYALDVPQLSRRHARLDVDDDAVWATDLGSTNGSSVRRDGALTTLAADVAVPMTAGSQLVVAGQVIVEVLGVRT
jgi:hypothetical protein